MSIQSEDAKYYAQKLTGATSPSMQPSNPSPQQQSQQPPAQQKQPVPKPDLPASPSVTVSPIKSKPMGASNSSRSLNNIAVGGSPLSRFQTPTSQPHLNGNMNYENIPLPNTVSPHENIDVLNKVSSVQHLDYPSMSIAERMANLTGTAVIDETLAQWGNQIKGEYLLSITQLNNFELYSHFSNHRRRIIRRTSKHLSHPPKMSRNPYA